jgi:hypothetical protein
MKKNRAVPSSSCFIATKKKAVKHLFYTFLILFRNWNKEVNDKRKRNSKATPSLLKALYNTFKKEFLYLGIVHVLKEMVLG